MLDQAIAIASEAMWPNKKHSENEFQRFPRNWHRLAVYSSWHEPYTAWPLSTSGKPQKLITELSIWSEGCTATLSAGSEKLNTTAKQLADIKHKKDKIIEQLRKAEQQVEGRKRSAAPRLCQTLTL